VDVDPDDLVGYSQCHFFAGVAGWPRALRLAGVPDLECWAGSPPCQPFSGAGKRRGTEDERHLWPEFLRLIAERRPLLVVGEQVKEAVALGWLDLVSSELEAEGYACGAVVLGAHGVGAPHLRQRLYWAGVLGDADDEEQVGPLRGGPGGVRALRHPDDLRQLHGEGRHEPQRGAGELAPGEPGAAGFWGNCEWVRCADGRHRPVEPGTCPVADRVPKRVGRLRGYDNAVVPQVASEFVKALIGR
jgi:DNA (cytosine-5)-methyltransferase 1